MINVLVWIFFFYCLIFLYFLFIYFLCFVRVNIVFFFLSLLFSYLLYLTLFFYVSRVRFWKYRVLHSINFHIVFFKTSFLCYERRPFFFFLFFLSSLYSSFSLLWVMFWYEWLSFVLTDFIFVSSFSSSFLSDMAVLFSFINFYFKRYRSRPDLKNRKTCTLTPLNFLTPKEIPQKSTVSLHFAFNYWRRPWEWRKTRGGRMHLKRSTKSVRNSYQHLYWTENYCTKENFCRFLKILLRNEFMRLWV